MGEGLLPNEAIADQLYAAASSCMLGICNNKSKSKRNKLNEIMHWRI